MVRGLLAVRTSGVTTGTAAFELIAPVGKGCYLREMQITLAAATASTYGLGRPAAKGVTPTTPVNLLSEAYGDAAEILTKTALAWATPPTIPAKFLKRIGFPATIGSEIRWVFEHGLYVPADGTLILWNLGSNGVIDVNVVVDE